MNLGKTILELRKQKQVTQDELAAELGVTAAAISKWENGYTLPDILMLCALADYFDVTTDKLLGRSPKPFCAAVATSSLELGSKIQELVEQYGIRVRHLIYGSFEDALEIIEKDPSVTHLFSSFDEPLPESVHRQVPDHIFCLESHSETQEKVLEGFRMVLQNMPAYENLIQTIPKKN